MTEVVVADMEAGQPDTIENRWQSEYYVLAVRQAPASLTSGASVELLLCETTKGLWELPHWRVSERRSVDDTAIATRELHEHLGPDATILRYVHYRDDNKTRISTLLLDVEPHDSSWSTPRGALGEPRRLGVTHTRPTRASAGAPYPSTGA